MSLDSHSSLIKEGDDHVSLVLFTKVSRDKNKTVPVVNLHPVRFIDGPTKQGRTENIQGYW